MGVVEKQAPKSWRKPEYRKQVERILRDYPILKLAIEEEQLPSYIPVYQEKTSPLYSEYNSMTEKYAIRLADKKLQIMRIERALQALNSEERMIIEMRYFDLSRPTDNMVCIKLEWNKRTYYRLKNEALRKLALTLNII
ncbi:hypothetical protein C1X05_00095 [Laceyella sacchari]|uniref:Phage transcriptional activator, RinA family/phage transcriptional regulator, ArpU family n=1 Tax=Laceyella tengchongensis TaxID=574699 RepID=A0AA45WQC0_9BACL|nr:ArpU family phage packaging/lysis transcriptional regulator [Laceyella tengchongensis]AUS07413.1 hypothetical protein C1X05_00095 [Laceyella sacchari]MRG28792.1 DUF1492 domain-containing protein [Laceyella tengchongensis]SMP25450.1 phage transcriptional activator, RinA family/phage transcriptional regulator, ArpU family [Laceyella tengchongensis]